ncbi:MAG: sensor histidine kinase [Rhodobacterales bacterium]|nr:sensor histidine kinase [Rhodobacterales bacterium]
MPTERPSASQPSPETPPPAAAPDIDDAAADPAEPLPAREAILPTVRSLRWSLLGLLALATVPATILMIVQATSEYYRDRQDIERSLLRVAQIAASEERDLISGAKQVLVALATQPAVYELRQPQCDQAVHNVFLGLQAFENIAAFDREGHPVCSEKEIPANATIAHRDWYKEILAGADFVVSERVISAITGQEVITAAVPLHDKSGNLTGVLDITIGTGWLAYLSRISKDDDFSFSALIATDGQPLDAQHFDPEFFAKLPPQEKLAAAQGSEPAVLMTEGRDGVKRAFAITPLVRDKLYLLIAHEESDLFGWARFDLLTGLVFPVAIWLAALICLWIGIQHLVLRWLKYLGRFARAYGDGNFDLRPENIEQAPGEFRRLAQAMSVMAAGIERHTDELQQALVEKSWLIREIHHRVKNNLQIVSSLFNLQMRRISDPAQRAVFADAQSRLNALELVHRTLYEAENLKEINLRIFLSEIVTQLIEFRALRRDTVVLRHDLPEVWVDPDMAVPLGLLVTEVVTNSLKHAFPGGRRGVVELELTAAPEGGSVLVIRDDGVGQEPEATGFGSQLIGAFARQLGGEAKAAYGPGMTMTVRVPGLNLGGEAPPPDSSEPLRPEPAGEVIAVPAS